MAHLPEGSGVDDALVAYLNGDATLRAALPDGAYYAEAPPGAKRYLLVELIAHEDTGAYAGADAFHAITYLVRAIALSTLVAEPAMAAIAERLHALLQDAALAVPGYAAGITLARTTRIRDTVPDLVDKTLRWYSRGGQYVAHASCKGIWYGNSVWPPWASGL